MFRLTIPLGPTTSRGPGGFGTREALEIGAVVLTGAGHLVASRAGASDVFIPAVVLGWGGYVGYRAATEPGFLGDLGFSGENLGRAARDVALLSGGAALAMGAYGAASGHLRLDPSLVPLLVLYPAWGITQQALVQGFVTRHLDAAGLPVSVVVPVSAAAFGAVHLPNWPLTAATTATRRRVRPALPPRPDRVAARRGARGSRRPLLRVGPRPRPVRRDLRRRLAQLQMDPDGSCPVLRIPCCVFSVGTRNTEYATQPSAPVTNGLTLHRAAGGRRQPGVNGGSAGARGAWRDLPAPSPRTRGSAQRVRHAQSRRRAVVVAHARAVAGRPAVAGGARGRGRARPRRGRPGPPLRVARADGPGPLHRPGGDARAPRARPRDGPGRGDPRARRRAGGGEARRARRARRPVRPGGRRQSSTRASGCRATPTA